MNRRYTGEWNGVEPLWRLLAAAMAFAFLLWLLLFPAPVFGTSGVSLAQASVWRGHRIDPTGLYYMGKRYYEPMSGRFVSPDPFGHAASLSLYDYCSGDPVNGLDPTGMFGVNPSGGSDSQPGPFEQEYQTLMQNAKGLEEFNASANRVMAMSLLMVNPIGDLAELGEGLEALDAVAELGGTLPVEMSQGEFEFASGNLSGKLSDWDVTPVESTKPASEGIQVAQEQVRKVEPLQEFQMQQQQQGTERTATQLEFDFGAAEGIPNPGGRLGDALTRQTTTNVINDLNARGFTDISQEVLFEKGPLGLKNRLADVVGVNPQTGESLIINIGKQTRSGIPIMRERRALDDIIFSPTIQNYQNSRLLFIEKGASGLPTGL